MKADSKIEPEEDFWDLGDDDLDSGTDDKASKETSLSLDQDKLSIDAPQETGKKITEDTRPQEDAELEADLEIHTEMPAPDVPTPLVAQGSVEKDSSRDTPDLVGNTPLSSLEKGSLVVVIALLIGAVAWGLATFYDHAPEGTLIVFDEDFPVEGNFVAVDEIETYWRKPIRIGVNADRGVKLNAVLIPCARIKLTGSGSAAIALSFQNSEKELIGDPVSLEVKDGKFLKNGSDEIIISSTAGFTQIAEINSYSYGDIPPWSLLIVESEPGTSPSYKDEDQKLLVIRIDHRVQSSED